VDASAPATAEAPLPPILRKRWRWGRVDDWIAYLPIVATTILAKLTIPGGPANFEGSWLLIFGAVLLGLTAARMRLDPSRLALFLLTIAGTGALQLFRGDAYSLPSFVLMVAVYFCYVVGVPRGADSAARALAFFGDLATALAVLGIAQFALQFAIGPDLVFPIENLLPKAIVVTGYNMQVPLAYGSAVYKANGVFLLEPSFFSQVLAMAVIVELIGRSRWQRLAIYAAGLVVSYSGTGLIVLACTLPLLMIRRGRWNVLMLAIALACVALVFAEPLKLDLFLNRATEFGDTRSSGFERFIGPFYVLEKFQWGDPLRAAFGLGAGTFKAYAARADFPAAEMAFHKIVFEFGLVGALVNFGFMGFCVVRSRAPIELRLAAIVMFLMNGIYTAVPHGLALGLLIWPSQAGLGRRALPVQIPVQATARASAAASPAAPRTRSGAGAPPRDGAPPMSMETA
jgi:hypothetical protein